MASQMTTTNQTQSCSSYQTVGSRLCTTYQDKTVGPVHSVKSQRDKNKILVSYLLYNHRYSSVEETRNKCLVLKQKKNIYGLNNDEGINTHVYLWFSVSISTTVRGTDALDTFDARFSVVAQCITKFTFAIKTSVYVHTVLAASVSSGCAFVEVWRDINFS